MERRTADRRQHNERLERALALAESVVAHALDAIVTVDQHNCIVAFNPAAERMFGRTAAQVRGQAATILMPERFRAAHIGRMRSYPERGAPGRRLGGVGSGLCGLRADGSEFPMEAAVSAAATSHGLLVTAVIRDVTEAARAMQALRDSENRLALAMESAGLGSAEVNLATGELVASNLDAARLLGLGDDPARWVMPSFEDPIHPEDREYVRATLDAIVRQDRALDVEFRLLQPDGSVRWTYGRGRLRRDAEGRPEAVFGVLMDIDERRRHEAQLRDLSQRLLVAQEDERRRIARELHDQVGQALTAALINLQMVPGHATSVPLQELHGDITAVLQQVRQMSLDLRPSMLDSLGLESALRWYLDRQRSLGGFAVELACALPARLPPERETLLFRLVQEAFTNILRHASARRVRVEVAADAERVTLTVSDDGVGFDAQAALARAREGGSLGVIGMAERAELAGGTLRIESKPGAGTTVTAVVPLRW